MTLFHSRREFALWLALFVYILHLVSFNWWTPFFQTLQSQNQSYRLLQIWVQADSPKRPFVVPIGSSDPDFQDWSQGIGRLLQQACRYPDVPFLFNLVCDQKTLYQHNDLFLEWSEKYPSKITFTLYEDLLSPLPNLTNAPNQCENGIAPACSDLLRLIALHNALFDYNVYMDIDTFLYRRKSALNPFLPISPFARSSPHFFGLNMTTPGLAQSTYTYVGPQLDHSALHINNDFLVDFQTPLWLWSFVQELGFQRLKPNEPFFDILAERPFVQDFPSYLQHLNKKVHFALTNPAQNINQVPLVINTVGPGLWKDLYLRGLSSRYPLPIIPSNGNWMNHVGKVYGNTSASDLLLFFPEQVQNVELMLMLNFLSHDYFYFQARNAPWLEEIQSLVVNTLNQLPQENFLVGQEFFQSSYVWLEEIAHA